MLRLIWYFHHMVYPKACHSKRCSLNEYEQWNYSLQMAHTMWKGIFGAYADCGSPHHMADFCSLIKVLGDCYSIQQRPLSDFA